MSYTEQDRARDRAEYVAALQARHAELVAAGWDFAARGVLQQIALVEGGDE